MQPVSSGYADVKDIRLYREIYGQGEPLVLIHGGLTTIGEMQGWMPSSTSGSSRRYSDARHRALAGTVCQLQHVGCRSQRRIAGRYADRQGLSLQDATLAAVVRQRSFDDSRDPSILPLWRF